MSASGRDHTRPKHFSRDLREYEDAFLDTLHEDVRAAHYREVPGDSIMVHKNLFVALVEDAYRNRYRGLLGFFRRLRKLWRRR